MDAAEAGEFGALQPRDGGEEALLLTMGHLGLEADHVVKGAERVVLAQLDDRRRLVLRVVGVGQPDRLHRPEGKRPRAALGHHLDRQAGLEIGGVLFPVLERHLVGCQQGFDEGVILPLVHRAVDVVLAPTFFIAPVVAGLKPSLGEIDAVLGDDGRDGVEKGQVLLAAQFRHRPGQGRRRQRPGGDDDGVPVPGRQAPDLAALDPDPRLGLQRPTDLGAEPVPVDGERRAGRHPVLVGGGHDE